MTAGLLIVAGSLFWQGHLQVDTSYGFLIGAFMLMGLGMGLVMSPMSTAGDERRRAAPRRASPPGSCP